MADGNYLIELLLTAPQKRCSRCGVEKSHDCFYTSKSASSGLQPYCKPCSSDIQKDYNNRPEVIAKRKSRKENPNRVGIKQCALCKEVKLRLDFYISSHSSDGLHNWCKACTKQQRSLYAAEHQEQGQMRDKERWSQFRSFVDTIKSQPCNRCGNTFPPCAMDFHHRDPSRKSFTIGTSNRFRIDRVLEEIAKCEVLCANCHRIVEWEEQPNAR